MNDKTFKTILLLLPFFLSVTLSGMGQTPNRWNVYAGGSISHICQTPLASSDKTYGWGGGAFIGSGYEINFNPQWSLTPQVEFSFDDNGGILNATEDIFFNNHAMWQNYWSISIPVLAAYRFSVSSSVNIRIGTGIYAQEGLYGKRYIRSFNNTDKESTPGNFERRFNTGIMGEVAVETGKHLSFMFRAKYPFLNKSWFMKTLVLSAGIRYSF